MCILPKNTTGGRKEMLAINIEDVISVLNTCKPYLIGLAVVLVLAIVAMVACRKMARSKKFLIRGEAPWPWC